MITQLGPYWIDEELAEGGMARVFVGRLRGLGGFEKKLVVKQIKPELAQDPRFVELFVREANTLVLLSHPHIVPVYELFAVEGNYYFSMEYVQGATLHRMLQLGPVAPALVAHIGAQVCEALAYAHARFGVLHRDITPRNIIIDQAGHARLLDFGIATTSGAADPDRFGSPGYMAPEQVRRRPLSHASDLFGVGAVLGEALIGRPLFAPSAESTLAPAAPLAPPSAADLPLVQLIEAMLQIDPAARPASAAAAAQNLRSYLAETRPEGVLEEAQQRVREAQKARPRTHSERPRSGGESRKLETRPIAMNPALSEMIRSSGGTLPAALSPASEGPHTRPLTGRQPRAADPSDSRTTRRWLKAWPLLASFAFLCSLWPLWQRQAAMSADGKVDAQEPSAAAPLAADALKEPGDPRTRTRERTRAPARERTAVDAQLGPNPGTGTGTRTTGAEEGAPSSAVQPQAPSEPLRERPGQPPAEASARLSVNAVPWAEVRIDGRLRGTTPVRDLVLPAGTHAVALSCPPLGVEKRLHVELSPGKPARIVVDLTQSPPDAFLDGHGRVR